MRKTVICIKTPQTTHAICKQTSATLTLTPIVNQPSLTARSLTTRWPPTHTRLSLNTRGHRQTDRQTDAESYIDPLTLTPAQHTVEPCLPLLPAPPRALWPASAPLGNSRHTSLYLVCLPAPDYLYLQTPPPVFIYLVPFDATNKTCDVNKKRLTNVLLVYGK